MEMSRGIWMRRCGAIVGALALLLLVPALVSAVWTNAGMLVLRDTLLARVDLAPGTYPIRNALQGDATAVQALQYLRRAVALNGDSLAARWELGRAALAVGDVEMAADTLEALAGELGHNPLLYGDVLMALSYGGQPEEVTALYESIPPPQRTQVISDAVALAYLDLMISTQVDQEARQGEVARRLGQAVALRPGDLYANYHLWKQARGAGDAEATAVHSDTLTEFPLEAIHPVDDRLLDYAAEVIPTLFKEGLWDRDKTLNVISFLAWQHSEAVGVERLLERLIERYPIEPDWSFYLAELYHRQGDLGQAQAAYRQVLAADPEYAPAVLRLGMVAEAKSQVPNAGPQEQLEEAARWYGQYHETVPDDLLGLKRLAEVCAALGEAGAEGGSCQKAALQEELEARADDQRIVAEWLGVAVEDVEVGPSLVENGGFEEGEKGQVERWYFWAYSGRGGEGLYFAGLDSLAAEGNAARIIGLRGGPVGDGTATYGEYIGEELTLPPGDWYIISSYYRSQNLDGNGLLFVGEDSKGGARLTHTYLEDSSGDWHKVSVLVPGQSQEMAVIPVVRNWGLGSVWFDDVQVRPIWLSEGTTQDAGGKGKQ
jgi:tetratricopeptide (TPR) repeat protein